MAGNHSHRLSRLNQLQKIMDSSNKKIDKVDTARELGISVRTLERDMVLLHSNKLEILNPEIQALRRVEIDEDLIAGLQETYNQFLKLKDDKESKHLALKYYDRFIITISKIMELYALTTANGGNALLQINNTSKPEVEDKVDFETAQKLRKIFIDAHEKQVSSEEPEKERFRQLYKYD